jgi:O-antigen/teichoic acid export membrane protein
MVDSEDRSLVSAQQAHYSSAILRTALAHFLLGKFASAALSFATLLLLLRSLSVEDYGTYVTLIAIQGVAVLLSSLGLDSAIDRYMPELRLTHSEGHLRMAVLVALLLRLLVLLVVLAILLGLSQWLIVSFGKGEWGELFPLLLVMVLVGGLFNFSSNILDTLLLQKSSQLSGFAYVFIRLAVLLTAVFYTKLQVEMVIYAEIVSTTIALCMSLLALIGYFLRSPKRAEVGRLFDKSMTRRILTFSCLNYGARLLSQTQGPHGLRLMVTYLLGIGATAKFGFIMSLSDLLERYLPTTLLARLIRPVFVTRYTTHRDFSQINAFASLLAKINLLVVAPAVMLAIVYGPYIIQLMAGEKYSGTEWLLVMALILLVPNSQKVVIGLVANTLEKNAMQFAGGIFSVLGLCLGILLGLEFGLYGILAGAISAAIAYNIYSVDYLRRQGYPYTSDMRGAAKIIFASVVGILGAGLISLADVSSPIVLLSALLGVGLYWFLVRMLNSFGAKDRELLAQVMPKKLRWALKLL